MRMEDKVDETIVAMCDEIQKEIKGESLNRYETIPDMVNALAKLISARANTSIKINSDGSITVSADHIQVNQEIRRIKK